jgi:Domain of unknown function (DUF4386)
VLFALTFVTSFAGFILYDPVLNDADYILGDGADTRVQFGALCEIFLAITNIGTAVVLWPIVKRQSETLALSYVASRIVESTISAGCSTSPASCRGGWRCSVSSAGR